MIRILIIGSSLVKSIQDNPDNILKLKVNRSGEKIDIILVPAVNLASEDEKRLCWYISR